MPTTQPTTPPGGSRRSRLRRFISPPSGTAYTVELAPEVAAREIFRRFWPYARPYRRLLFLTFGLVAAAPVIEAATLWLFKLVVDNVLVPRDLHALVPIGIAFLALTVLDGVVGFADQYISTWVEERFLFDLRNAVFEHLSRLSMDFFDRRRLGDVQARLTGDLTAIETFVISGITDALSYLIEILIFAGLMFYLSWQLAAVSLLVAPVFYLLTRRFNRLIKHASRQRRRRSAGLSAISEEVFGNIALIQAYGREESVRTRFEEENAGNFGSTMAATRLTALFSPVTDLVRAAGVMAVVVMGTWEVSSGRLSLGGLMVFLVYLSQLYSPIRRLASLSNTVWSAAAAAERVIEFLEEQPTVKEPAKPVRLRHAVGRVEFDHVSFRYATANRDSLDDVSFEVEPGEMVALVGASGAGKSTITKLLLRFHDPTRGAVRLDGHDLRTLPLADLRGQMALLLQEPMMFDATVAENIAFGRVGASAADVRAAADAADATDFIERLPDGFGTRLGQKGRRLSGGQRQRIAIARATIREAPVLILDEPTTGLDAETAERILEPLRRLRANRTTILISHNLTTLREASRILVLEHGSVVEAGTPEQLLSNEGRYRALWRLHELDRTPGPMEIA